MTSEPTWVYVLDLLGTSAFAFSGAIRALDRRPDIIGMTILAGATAVGGGVIRDLMLGHSGGPVFMLADINYPLVILASALAAFAFPWLLKKEERFFKYFDAVGLGVFSAIGASLAIEQQLNWLSVLFVAAITGAGGGVIRDVLLSEMPLVLYQEVYVLAVIAGAAVMLLIHHLLKPLLPPNMVEPFGAGFVAAMAVTTIIRFLAVHYRWSLPRIRFSA